MWFGSARPADTPTGTLNPRCHTTTAMHGMSTPPTPCPPLPGHNKLFVCCTCVCICTRKTDSWSCESREACLTAGRSARPSPRCGGFLAFWEHKGVAMHVIMDTISAVLDVIAAAGPDMYWGKLNPLFYWQRKARLVPCGLSKKPWMQLCWSFCELVQVYCPK